MTRKPPASLTLPAWKTPEAADTHTITLQLKLITPMFGGGHTAREIDEAQPIRAAAIRGHLRFWWRATAGAQYSTSEKLYKAESELWGSSADIDKGGNASGGQGKVSVSVVTTNFATEPCATYEQNEKGEFNSLPNFGKLPGYALFPFKGKAEKKRIVEPPSKMSSPFEFKLILRYDPELEPSSIEILHNTLHYWIAFGGIGARTRRGCGSLACNDFISTSALTSTVCDAIPTIYNSSYILGPEVRDAVEAWKTSVNLYRDFRQKENFARNQGVNRIPGRSRWPEPDSIRRLCRSSSPNHSPTHSVQIGFPRADLGLPIVFQFKDEKYGDPPTHILELEKYTRMASPVITKARANSNGTFSPLILVLNSPHAWDGGNLKLTSNVHIFNISPVQTALTPVERNQVTPMTGKPVREALLDYAAKTWKSKIEVIK